MLHGRSPYQFCKSQEIGGHTAWRLERSGKKEGQLIVQHAHPVLTLCSPCARWFHFNYLDFDQTPRRVRYRQLVKSEHSKGKEQHGKSSSVGACTSIQKALEGPPKHPWSPTSESCEKKWPGKVVWERGLRSLGGQARLGNARNSLDVFEQQRARGQAAVRAEAGRPFLRWLLELRRAISVRPKAERSSEVTDS